MGSDGKLVVLVYEGQRSLVPHTDSIEVYFYSMYMGVGQPVMTAYLGSTRTRCADFQTCRARCLCP